VFDLKASIFPCAIHTEHFRKLIKKEWLAKFFFFLFLSLFLSFYLFHLAVTYSNLTNDGVPLIADLGALMLKTPD
jgi:hypothetical protein